eukprot:gene12531-13817_t
METSTIINKIQALRRAVISAKRNLALITRHLAELDADVLNFGEEFEFYKDLNATIFSDQLDDAELQQIEAIPENQKAIDLAAPITPTMQPHNQDQDTKTSPNPSQHHDSDEDHQQDTPEFIPSKPSPTSAMDTNA